MSDELQPRLDAFVQTVQLQLAGQMLEQGIDHLLTAQAAFIQVGEITSLREDMRSYALELVKLLTPVINQAGTMAHDRATKLEDKITDNDD